MKALNRLLMTAITIVTIGAATSCGGDNSGDLVENLSPIGVTILSGGFNEGESIEFHCNDASDLKVNWGDGTINNECTHTFSKWANRITISGHITSLSISDENGVYKEGNHSIDSVIFSSTITALPAHSFNIFRLREAMIPNSISVIGEHAFDRTDHPITFLVAAKQKPGGWADTWSRVDSFLDIVIWGIKLAASNNYICMMTNYNGANLALATLNYNENDELTIPDAVVFEGTKYQIASIEIADSIVKTIHLPKYLKTLDYSFSNCDSLKTIDYSKSTNIEFMSNAFVRCPFLEEIFIPKTVKLIPSNSSLVDTCPNISKVTVEEGNPYYINPNNCNAVISKIDNTLVFGCKTTVIPNGVETIGVAAFKGSSIQKITLPDSVKSIKEAAFMYCNQLESVTLSTNLQTIANGAFSDSGLKKITIPSLVKSIQDLAFNHCLYLNEIDVTAFTSKDNIPLCRDDSFRCYNPDPSAKTKTFVYSNSGISPDDFYAKGWPESSTKYDQQIVWKKESSYEY